MLPGVVSQHSGDVFHSLGRELLWDMAPILHQYYAKVTLRMRRKAEVNLIPGPSLFLTL